MVSSRRAEGTCGSKSMEQTVKHTVAFVNRKQIKREQETDKVDRGNCGYFISKLGTKSSGG